ncbi:MAG: hypothetical protein ACTSRA_20415, partial [Promethearchaeota archaeon]
SPQLLTTYGQLLHLKFSGQHRVQPPPPPHRHVAYPLGCHLFKFRDLREISFKMKREKTRKEIIGHLLRKIRRVA